MFCALSLRKKCPRVKLQIQTKCRKIQTRNNSVFGYFSRSVCNPGIFRTLVYSESWHIQNPDITKTLARLKPETYSEFWAVQNPRIFRIRDILLLVLVVESMIKHKHKHETSILDMVNFLKWKVGILTFNCYCQSIVLFYVFIFQNYSLKLQFTQRPLISYFQQ